MRQLKITNKITNRESVSLEKYLNDIAKLSMLTPEQEAEYARKIREGDEDALEVMCKSNLRFVVSVAKQYQNQGLSLSDLINEGNVGLIKAAKRFDETKGFKFISYAVWWIRQSILQAIVEYSRIVRMPVNKVGSYNRLNEAYITFVQEFEREPSPEELAEALGVAVKDVNHVLKSNMRHVSFDATIGTDEDDISMIDIYMHETDDSPDMGLMKESIKKEVEYGMTVLAPREMEVLSAYFGLDGNKPLTLEEIGDMFGLTRERVRQVKERAIRRLRR